MPSQQLDDRLSASVNVANGNLLLAQDDVAINQPNGFPLNSVRYYNSSIAAPFGAGVNAGTVGQYGMGWTSTLGADVALAIFGDGSVALTLGDGSSYLFEPAGAGWLAPYGLAADLTSPSSGHYVVALHSSGDQLDFTVVNPSEPSVALLTAEKDRYGNPITLNYSSSYPQGQLESVTDVEGRALTITDSTTNDDMQTTTGTQPISELEDSTDRTWGYSYGSEIGVSDNELQTYTDPALGTTTYGYTSGGWPLIDSITDPDGNVTLISYDSSGRVTSITRTTNDEHTTGPTTTFVYDDTSGACPSTFEDQAVSDTRVEDPDYDSSDPSAGHYVDYCTNQQDQVLETFADGDDPVHVTDYNVEGFPQSETVEPSDATTKYGYDGSSTLVTCQEVDANDTGTDCADDSSGLKSTYDYMNSPPTGGWSGGAAGLGIFQATDGYDTQGNQNASCDWNETQASGSPTPPSGACQAPGTGDPSEPTGALQDEWTVGAGQTDPLEFKYTNSTGTDDVQALLHTSQVANGNQTDYAYTSAGDLSTITPPSITSGTALGASSITPDGLSRPHVIEDGNGVTQTINYDAMDRITSIVIGDTTEVSWTYYDDGVVHTHTDSQGTTTYTYNALNQLTNESNPTIGLDNTYTYDAAGNLMSINDGSGTLTSTQCPGLSGYASVCYQYNGLNQNTEVTDASGTTDLAYDESGRLYGIT